MFFLDFIINLWILNEQGLKSKFLIRNYLFQKC